MVDFKQSQFIGRFRLDPLPTPPRWPVTCWRSWGQRWWCGQACLQAWTLWSIRAPSWRRAKSLTSTISAWCDHGGVVLFLFVCFSVNVLAFFHCWKSACFIRHVQKLKEVINAVHWHHERGYYKNLQLWQQHDSLPQQQVMHTHTHW